VEQSAPLIASELRADFCTVMSRASVAVIVKNAEGYFIFVNPAAERLLGYGPGQLGGIHVTEVSADDPAWLLTEWERFKAQSVWNGSLMFRRGSGDLVTTALNAFVATTTSGGRAYTSMLRQAGTGQRVLAANYPAGNALNLTVADCRLLQLLAEGFTDKDIAAIIGLSDWAIAREVTILLQKMRVRSRTAACVTALKARLIA
jgi:PAS domain S-box-containing protein